jgi:vacuolar-type H+-ATPase subunit F/Vma7
MIVALGEESQVRGYGLAAVRVMTAEGPEEAVAAWERLPEGAAVLLLTPMARAALARRLDERPRLLTVVLP